MLSVSYLYNLLILSLFCSSALLQLLNLSTRDFTAHRHRVDVCVCSYQKTNAALQNFGDYASRKLGAVRYYCLSLIHI